MDTLYYKTKIEQALQNRKPYLNTIYQYMHKSKIWKVVNRRCGICGARFNKNNNNKFDIHKCKKINKY